MIKYRRKHVSGPQTTLREPFKTFYDRMKRFEENRFFSILGPFFKHFLKHLAALFAHFAWFWRIGSTENEIYCERSIILQKATVQSFIYVSTLPP